MVQRKRMSLVDDLEFQKCQTNKILTNFLFILCISLILYITFSIISQNKEQRKIDNLVSEIQNDIFIKQCALDKMYCCKYKDKVACDKWVEANCIEKDGSLQINC
jgi:hypothetical protein